MSLPSAGFFSVIFFDKIYIFRLLLFPLRVIYIYTTKGIEPQDFKGGSKNEKCNLRKTGSGLESKADS